MNYSTKLAKLNDKDLLQQTKNLVHHESQSTARIIAHLAEIQNRKLHLDLGFSSLFDYCVTELRLDPGQVYLRTQVASKCRQYPLILEKIASGELTLTNAGKIASSLEETNAQQLIEDCCGKTRNKVDLIIAAIKPKPVYKDQIRKTPQQKISTGNQSLPLTECKSLSVAPREKPAAKVEVATPETFNIRFSAGKRFRAALERLAELKGVSSEGNLEELLLEGLELALDKRDPKRKEERREKREEKIREKEEKSKQEASPKTDPAKVSTRYIPTKLRRVVEKRAGYQCEYHSSAGRRCPARSNLHLDHVRPWSMGGDHSLENLRVLCRAHNLRKAELDFAH